MVLTHSMQTWEEIKNEGDESIDYCDCWNGKLENVPKSTTCLSLRIPDNINEDYFEQLPGDLTHLAVNLDNENCLNIFKYTPKLIYLELKYTNLPRGCIQALPSTLRHLISWNTFNFTNNDLINLPKTLIELVIDMSQKITDDGIRFLPRGLKKLSLKYNNLTDKCIVDLPPYLTHLSLQRNKNLTDQMMHLLPSTLIYLDLLSCDKITNKGIEYLPKQLTFFETTGSNITSECFIHLPRNMSQFVILSPTYIDIHHVNHLPKTLIYLTLGNSQNSKYHEKIPHIVNDMNIQPADLTVFEYSLRQLPKLEQIAIGEDYYEKDNYYNR